MLIEEYESFVAETISDKSTVNFISKLTTAGLGLGGEGSECAELVWDFYYTPIYTENEELFKDKFKKELGDLMYYTSFSLKFVSNSSFKELLGNLAEFERNFLNSFHVDGWDNHLKYAGLGLAKYSGKYSDTIKKILFQGLEFNEEVNIKLKNYILSLVRMIIYSANFICGSSLQEIIDLNCKKLKDRYKNGKFSIEEFLAKEKSKVD